MVNHGEAAAVRTIFAEYLTARSVRQLSARLDELGIVSKTRIDRYGRVSGGKALSRGALYNILRNPIYIGKVRHKEDLHDGLHEAIIDDASWEQVQAQLMDHGGKTIGAVRRSAKRSLDGVLFDSEGRAMLTTYASKSVRREGVSLTKRYWYYTSKKSAAMDCNGVERLPAREVERLVLTSVEDRLSDKTWLSDQVRLPEGGDTSIADILQAAEARLAEITAGDGNTNDQSLVRLIDRIDAQKERLRIRINFHALLNLDQPCIPITGTFEVLFQRRQNGRAKPIIIKPEDALQPDPDLIALVADARRWAHELLDGQAPSIHQITEREGLRSGSVSRILPLAWLAPDISTAILEGRQPADLTAKTLRDLKDLPLDWAKQREILGFPHL